LGGGGGHDTKFEIKTKVHIHISSAASLLHRSCCLIWKHNSSVSVVTGVGLDSLSEFRFPVGKGTLHSPQRPGRLWGPPSFRQMGTRDYFPWFNESISRSRLLTFIYCRSKDCVKLYLHSPLRLHRRQHVLSLGYSNGSNLNHIQLIYSGHTSCGMVDVIDVSEKSIAYIFRVEKFAR
jgi:hypothetical protein